MKERISKLKNEALEAIATVTNAHTLEEERIKYLGKKGALTELSKGLATLSAEERPRMGESINDAKNAVATAIQNKKEFFEQKEYEEKLAKEQIDVTLPGRIPNRGHLHALSIVEKEAIEVLSGMGFTPVRGPELEDEFHNFEALNIPYYHPARDDHDSIYVSKDRLLRTHTSNMQIRTMRRLSPPVAFVAPGKCARRDEVDATHSPIFHQLECAYVNEGVTFADLKGAMLTFCKRMFGEDTEIRLRPDFFPFTEPSAEIAVSCFMCRGKGCSTCKGSGFIEILGAGMIHPTVLENVGYDSAKYSGFAFGMGIDRVALIKYKIPDIRSLYENNRSFLQQF